MNFEQARFNMVEQQIRPWDVLDQDVLDAFMTVRREEFVPPAYRDLAFSDIEMPLGNGKSMFKPVIEGKVLQALQICAGDWALEIGSGSGHFAALMAACGAEGHSVEIEPELAELAATNLLRQGVEEIKVHVGDGILGWAKAAPYDLIVYSGGLPQLPPSVLTQLKQGGRLFAFIGVAPVMTARLITRVGPERYQTEDVFESLVTTLRNAPSGEVFVF